MKSDDWEVLLTELVLRSSVLLLELLLSLLLELLLSLLLELLLSSLVLESELLLLRESCRLSVVRLPEDEELLGLLELELSLLSLLELWLELLSLLELELSFDSSISSICIMFI